jgi:hypothetical protein
MSLNGNGYIPPQPHLPAPIYWNDPPQPHLPAPIYWNDPPQPHLPAPIYWNDPPYLPPKSFKLIEIEQPLIEIEPQTNPFVPPVATNSLNTPYGTIPLVPPVGNIHFEETNPILPSRPGGLESLDVANKIDQLEHRCAELERQNAQLVQWQKDTKILMEDLVHQVKKSNDKQHNSNPASVPRQTDLFTGHNDPVTMPFEYQVTQVERSTPMGNWTGFPTMEPDSWPAMSFPQAGHSYLD